MAHSPDIPVRYVCLDCQVVSAATVVHDDDGDHDFEPPMDCGACGETNFVQLERYVHHHQ